MATLVRLARLVRHAAPSARRRREESVDASRIVRSLRDAQRAAQRLEAELIIGRQTLTATASRLGVAL
jgi:hypothetical protein